MNRILVATDGSARARDALDVAVDMAAERDAELIVAHVVPWIDVFSTPGVATCGILPHRPTNAERTLLEDAAEVAAGGGVFATTALLQGDAARQLVAYAESHDVDLIVLGSHGHGDPARAFLGSVSRRVLGESRRPVLIVPAPAAWRTPARRSAVGVGLGF